MRVLSFDVGAKYMGWSVLDDGPCYVESGLWGLSKSDNQTYQEYRLNLIHYWVKFGTKLIQTYKPNLIASETIPLVGSGSASAQSVLAATAVTTVQAMAVHYEVPIKQIAAVTVKARIGGKKTATKPKVRDGVISLLPVLESRRSDWTGTKAHFDETDALGVGLVALGYRASISTTG